MWFQFFCLRCSLTCRWGRKGGGGGGGRRGEERIEGKERGRRGEGEGKQYSSALITKLDNKILSD